LPEIVSQARCLVDEGYQEIVLTGVHIGAYGRDRNEDDSLAKVLESLLDTVDLCRIRLSSIEPGECSARLISLMASSPRICRHLHIPLQSGDDQVLAAMNRRYRTRDFARLVDDIMTAIPDVGIGTDVIVGFPGETDDCFQHSLDFVERLPLSYLHVFNYSKRPGTAAAEYPGQVSAETRKVRVRTFRRLRSEKIRAFGERFVGTHLQVLLEHRRQGEWGRLEGLSDNYIRLTVDGDDTLQGQVVDVRLEKMTGECGLGTVLRCQSEGRHEECTMHNAQCNMPTVGNVELTGRSETPEARS
jgi:threonylcarbamoyladenosine tRNA methylthiotransferase MtaB